MNGLLESYVWVRRDVLQIVYEEGHLPPGWRPSRKRGRDSWQWVKAKLMPSNAAASSSPLKSPTTGGNGSNNNNTTTNNNNNSPFGQVKLRRTSTTPIRRSATPSSSSSSSLRNLTVLVDDPDAGPFHQQNFTFETKTSDAYVVNANSWWQRKQQDGGSPRNQQPTPPPQDLTELSHLHEAAVVYCLKKRYEQEHIYTYTGRVLLALNPFCQLSNLYGQQVITTYREAAIDNTTSPPPPHVYATAQDAYSTMMLEGSNQSILVSGESGAGKTVTTKIILGYLTTLSKWKGATSSTSEASSVGIEAQVVHSNPILESFGNARTLRNDNSSRFGKFIDVRFIPRSGRLTSASIDTYLLEKVRLISPAVGERNYHIFYELLAGLSQRDRKDFLLGNCRAQDFHMTAVSGTFDRRDGIDDRKTFKDLKMALTTIGFTADAAQQLFGVCCAVLQCSNLTFTESVSGASQIDGTNPSLRHAVQLLGVSTEALNSALCCSAIEARGEILYKTLSRGQAAKALEALMKATYAALFSKIVTRINRSIAVADRGGGDGGLTINGGTRGASDLSIGVLDIFGFESFDTNSFEQLCINFCNEALQQQFNQFVFKEEQNEYQSEGIDWSFISFPDNQDILDLIEKRHDGILSILDEQNIVPGATDVTFSRTVYEKCGNHPRFSANSSQKILGIFCIEHYAGIVEYSTATFLEKNKDELPKETTLLLKSSSNPFIVSLGDVLSVKANASSPKGGDSGRQLRRANSSLVRESVGSQFTGQLRELRRKIEQTTPHYIRCLKPNDLLVPGSFVPGIIADQLRCAGVLEAIRVSRVGFPQRYKHADFLRRYQILATEQMPKHRRYYGERDLCELVVNYAAVLIRRTAGNKKNDASADEEATKGGIQMGKTKVFLRRFAFERLEYLRNKILEDSAVVVQAFARMVIARNRFDWMCYSACVLQRFVRKLYATRLAILEHQYWCATLIQKNWRGFYAERDYVASLYIAQWCQNTYRGMVAREICAFMMLDKRTKTIQSAWRLYRAKRRLRNIVRSIIKVQVLFRGYQAKQLLYELRREARDVRAIAKQRDLFKEEALRLRMELQTSRDNSVCSTESDPEEMRKLRTEIAALKLQLVRIGESSPISAHGAGMNGIHDRRLPSSQSSSFPTSNESKFLPPRSPAIGTVKSPSFWTSPLGMNRPSPTQLFPKSLLDDVEADALSPPKPSKDISPSSNQESLYEELGERNVIGTPFREQVSAFHRGILRGDLDRVSNILDDSEFAQLLVNECNASGIPAIHMAIASGNRELAKKLLDNGAAGNCQDQEGNTPLHVCTDPEIVLVLLESGHANPNIPNSNGLSPLHLAVGRLDVASVQHMLRHNADVNVADDTGWLTPLHLAARKASPEDAAIQTERPRARIASMLCRVTAPDTADLNFQDKNGNTPLHHVVVLEIAEACDILRIFLENGGKPNVANERGQTPLHLLCHNEGLREVGVMQEMLYDMLYHGANPNIPSQTGCTALHLTLYHRDIDSAVQVMNRGAELHLLWNKPKRWTGFWDDMGTSAVLALDMISDENALHRVLAAISKPQKWAPNRSWCMQCKTTLGSFARSLHCCHCGRLVCGACSQRSLSAEYFPKSFEIFESSWVCIVCEKILVSRQKDDVSTQPATSIVDGDGGSMASISRMSF